MLEFIKKVIYTILVVKLQQDIRKFKKSGTRFIPPLPDFPLMVRIETTTRCNLQCPHCPNSILSSNPDFTSDMDNTLYFKIIDEIACESPKTLVRPFGGGEPLMRKDIGELIKYAKDKGIRNISINTNGTLLTKKRRNELIKSGLNHIEVSIDAATKETYQKIKKSPLFDRVINNTIAYIKESKQFNPNNIVTVSFVLQKGNFHELEMFKKYWSGVADKINIREYHQHGGLIDEHGCFAEKNLMFRHPCPYLWNRMIINHDGKVPFCENDWEGKYAIGDANVKTLKQIWHSKEFSELRQEHINGTFNHPYCRNCTDWHIIKWKGL